MTDTNSKTASMLDQLEALVQQIATMELEELRTL